MAAHTNGGERTAKDKNDAWLQLIQCTPGTPMGKLLRQFWQPVAYTAELEPGTATTIRTLGEDLTLYRGESGEPHLVAQWADAHNALAQNWVKADPGNADFVAAWAKAHPEEVAQWVKDNPGTPEPAPLDLAVVFFESWSKASPGTWPSAVEHTDADGKTTKAIEPVKGGPEIQSVFFDMWRQDHREAILEDVPADLVTASGSGLDPDITLENARFQLERVASAWARDTKREPAQVRKEIEELLQQRSRVPFGGLAGGDVLNVLEVNLELRKRYGAPGGSAT